jgi:ribonuclease J
MCAERVRVAVLDSMRNNAVDTESLARVVRRVAGKFVSEQTKRRPMIVPVIMEA